MNGNEIKVNLVAQADEKSIAQAGKKISEGVEKQQRSTGKPIDGRMRASEAIARGLLPGQGGGAAAAAASGSVVSTMATFASAAAAFITAVGLIGMAMRKASNEAASLYAKALQGGAGLGYATKTSSLAGIIGVGENEVFQYGEAVKKMSGRISEANKDIARVTPNLTGVAWEARAAAYNFKALRHVMANDFADISRTVLVSSSKLTNKATGAWKAASSWIDKFVEWQNKVEKSITGKGPIFNESPMKALAVKLGLREPGGKGPAGNLYGNMNRLAGSAWERMGFVVGRGGADHAAKTAANTKRIAHLMEQLVNKLPHMAHEGRTYGSAQKP